MTEFDNDYDLKKIVRIKTKSTNIEMYVTPRYINHYVENEYEKFSINLLKNILKSNQTFVDIGAHYGYYSLVINKLLPKNKIIAVEPVKENFEILCKNFELNNIKNCNLINAAASDSEGKKNFVISHASDSSGFYGHPLAGNKKSASIKTISVGKLIKNENVGLIKIDVEGHEIPVFKDIVKNIDKKTNFLIEFNPKCQIKAGFRPTDLLHTIEENGYDIFLIIDNPNQGTKNVTQTGSSDYTLYKINNCFQSWNTIINQQASVNILCLPKNKYKLITFFSHSSNLGGAERSMLELLSELKTKNIFSHVVLPANGPIEDVLKKLSIPYDIAENSWWAGIDPKNENQIISIISKSVKNIVEYSHTLNKINPDLIYSNTIVQPWGGFVSLLLKKPHIWHIREYGELDHKLNFYLGYEDTINLIEKNSDSIIVNSKSVADHLIKYLKKITPIIAYNYIEISKNLLSEKIKNPYSNEKSTKIIVCGNVHKGKNQLEVIKAVNELISEGNTLELLILGQIADENYYKELNDFVIKNNLRNKIKFKKFQNNPYPYINASDIIIVPSQREAYGRVAVEGMLLKKPVIVTTQGGMDEIITNGKNGYKYELNDINSLKKYIVKLMNKNHASAIGESGYKSLNKFNNKNNYGNKIYREITKVIETFNTQPSTTYNILAETFKSLILNQRTLERYISLFKKNIDINCHLEHNFLGEEKNSFNDAFEYEDYKNSYVKFQKDFTAKNDLLKKQIEDTKQTISKLQEKFEQIQSSKYFKLWRLFCKLKSFISN